MARLTAVLALSLAALASAATNLLPIPPRIMWGWAPNVRGYCGETSLQSSGLFFGNYISQEQVRYAGGNEEVLIDVNLHTAATALAFNFERWNYNQKTPQVYNFLAWIKTHIDKEHPVIAGWYEKQPKGDADYDHIMPAVGYMADDNGVITELYYNDLWQSTPSTTAVPQNIATRSGCTQTKSPVQPFEYCMPTSYDYGLAVTGIVDPKAETYRIILDVGNATEPDWGAEDKLHEKPVTLYPRATVYGLTLNQNYALLRFDSAASLPKAGGFINGSWATRSNFTAAGAQYTFTALDPIQSDGTYFYRAVKI